MRRAIDRVAAVVAAAAGLAATGVHAQTAPTGSPGIDRPAASAPAAGDAALPFDRPLRIPVEGATAAALRDMFDEGRPGHRHEAIDIMAPRGTPVVAADDGRVVKLFTSVPGGLTVYQFDPEGRFAYYYAHLDRYAEGLKEGMVLKAGDPVGTVGTTGNAPPDAPHLHFAVFRLGPERQWWKGEAVNPYPALRKAAGGP